MRAATRERVRLERERSQQLMPVVTRRLEEAEAMAIFSDLPSVEDIADRIQKGKDVGTGKFTKKKVPVIQKAVAGKCRKWLHNQINEALLYAPSATKARKTKDAGGRRGQSR